MTQISLVAPAGYEIVDTFGLAGSTTTRCGDLAGVVSSNGADRLVPWRRRYVS